jgi:hypothetical protein
MRGSSAVVEREAGGWDQFDQINQENFGNFVSQEIKKASLVWHTL